MNKEYKYIKALKDNPFGGLGIKKGEIALIKLQTHDPSSSKTQLVVDFPSFRGYLANYPSLVIQVLPWGFHLRTYQERSKTFYLRLLLTLKINLANKK